MICVISHDNLMMKSISFCKFFLQLPAVYSPLFDAIGAIAEESCVYLEKLYQTQGMLCHL